MALSGVHITWGFANEALVTQQGQATLLYRSGTSSEAMATGAVSVTSAPTNAGATQQAILSIAASAPIFFVVGKSPTAPTSPPANVINADSAVRYYDPSTGPLDIVVAGGDKMAWVLA